MGWIPGLGRSLGGENGNPLQYSSLVNPMDKGAWWAMAHGVTKSQTQLSTCARTHTHTHVCSHTYTCVHTETHVCTHAHAHMCAYMRVCAHTYTCACTQGHTYTRVRAHMCVHTHTHVCTHTHYVPSLQLSHPDLISAQGHEKYSPISR